MSVIPLMSLDETIQNVDKMASMMKNWGWSIASFNGAYVATLYNETIEYQGGFIKYGWMPVTSQRCDTYFDALSFCLNSLWEINQKIEGAKKMAGGEGEENIEKVG